jgi:hypothetical protein
MTRARRGALSDTRANSGTLAGIVSPISTSAELRAGGCVVAKLALLLDFLVGSNRLATALL